MVEKLGRNDPCSCGSGKKYKNCCLAKQQPKGSSLGKRKFTAKVLSSGVNNKPAEQEGQQAQANKANFDYASLMDRSFGEALRSSDDAPPVLQNPAEYLTENEKTDSSKQ